MPPCSQIFFVGDVPVDYKMEAVVLLIRFENMIKRFLIQTETSFDASCLKCMEYIGYSNKNCKVIYESAI